MGLLSLPEIKQGLDDKFIPLEPILSGFRLVKSKLSEEDIQRLEKTLGFSLTASFRKMLLSFDFGNFSMGPIAYCNTGNYLAWLQKLNLESEAVDAPWWGSGGRPKGMLMVANSDSYAILLNNANGQLCALPHGRNWPQDSMHVAEHFEYFILGTGTIFFQRSSDSGNRALTADVAKEVGGQEGISFWAWLGE